MAYTIIIIFSAPFGIFYMKTEIWKQFFQKKILYNPLMGCFPFTNYHFQMGVTVMGFAEDFGHIPVMNHKRFGCTKFTMTLNEIQKVSKPDNLFCWKIFQKLTSSANGIWCQLFFRTNIDYHLLCQYWVRLGFQT